MLICNDIDNNGSHTAFSSFAGCSEHGHADADASPIATHPLW
jgi:hypothetical protein